MDDYFTSQGYSTPAFDQNRGSSSSDDNGVVMNTNEKFRFLVESGFSEEEAMQIVGASVEEIVKQDVTPKYTTNAYFEEGFLHSPNTGNGYGSSDRGFNESELPPQSQEGDEEEEEDSHVVELMSRGYTKEQAVNMVALEHSRNGGGLQEDQFVHDVHEDPRVEKLMQMGYTQEQAERAANAKTSSEIAQERSNHFVENSIHYQENLNGNEIDNLIESYMLKGYTQEQAESQAQMILSRNANPTNQYSYSDDGYEFTQSLERHDRDTEQKILVLMDRGYTHEQAEAEVLASLERSHGNQNGGENAHLFEHYNFNDDDKFELAILISSGKSPQEALDTYLQKKS